MKHLAGRMIAGISIVICVAVVGTGLLAGTRLSANQAQLPADTPAASSASTPQVPDQYRALYNGLKANLDAATAQLDKLDHGQKYPVTYAAELLTANNNVGTALLTSRAMSVSIKYLDGLQRLGVQGVTLNVAYPVFTPSFPNYSKYVSFYKNIVAQIRKRGMKLDVEAHVIFAKPPFSKITVDYSRITFAQFESALHQMDQAIIDQLHPDYMSILSEPDTLARLTPYSQLKDPAQTTKFVQYLLKGLKRGKTKVGAGTGSWLPPTYSTAFAEQTSLDYIGIHFYPISQRVINNAIAMVNVAKKNHKGVVVDEAWLYKTLRGSNSAAMGSNSAASGQGQTNVASAPDIFRLDNFSFWQPLDQEFLALMVKFARVEGVEYLSPFWSSNFFGYVNYDSSTSNLSYRALSSAHTQATLQNLSAGKVSSTGTDYHQLISKNTTKQKSQ